MQCHTAEMQHELWMHARKHQVASCTHAAKQIHHVSNQRSVVGDLEGRWCLGEGGGGSRCDVAIRSL